MVYKFVVLSDEDDTFVRELEFLDSHTLLDFHNLLQEELEFDKSQMASFYLAANNWEKEEEFTLIDMGAGSSTMEDAVLEEIIYKENQKLLYVFDFFNERALFIEYIGEVKPVEGREYPVCTNSKGLPPKQVVFGATGTKKFAPILIDYDEEENELVVDDIFFNGDAEEGLGDFDTFEHQEEEE